MTVDRLLGLLLSMPNDSLIRFNVRHSELVLRDIGYNTELQRTEISFDWTPEALGKRQR